MCRILEAQVACGIRQWCSILMPVGALATILWLLYRQQRIMRAEARHTLRRSMSPVLLAPDFDHHLFEARHDGRRSKVPEVRHSIPRAQAQSSVPWEA